MGKAVKTPAPPDPVATAQAQSQMNAETARTTAALNNVNQVTPYGSLTYTNAGDDWARQHVNQLQDAYNRGEYRPSYIQPGAGGGTLAGMAAAGANAPTGFDWNREFEAARASASNPDRDRWTATVNLSPAEQAALDRTNQAQEIYGGAALEQLGRARDVLSRPVDLSNNAVEGRLMELGRSRLDPILAQRRQGAETRLRNQGIMPGTEAWNAGMRDVMQAETDATNQLLLTGRQQAIQEMLTERGAPLNETAALINGTAVQYPQFGNTPQSQVAPTDYIGAVNANYQGQLANAQRQQQANNAALGGLFSLGSAALGGWASGAFGGAARAKSLIG